MSSARRVPAQGRRRPTVSAVLIVKDEEQVLDACLASVAWVDEIVVYDTGSSDRTREVAAEHTDVVVEGYWDDDFGAARNRALEHATCDWVLTIDADEVFVGDPETFRRELVGATATEHTMRIRHDRVLSAVALNESVGTRVFRSALYRYSGRIHELPQFLPGSRPVRGSTAIVDAYLVHSGYRHEVIAAKGKAERNLLLASLQADDAALEPTPAELAILRAHVARSLVMAGRYAEALAMAEELWCAALLPVTRAVELASAMASAAHVQGDRGLTETWFDRWEGAAPDRAWALARRAELAQDRGDFAAVLDALAQVPDHSVNDESQHLDRVDLASIEVWALTKAEQWDHACDVAIAAARAGRTAGEPGIVVRAFDGASRPIDPLLDLLSPDAWRTFAAFAAFEEPIAALGLLDRMHGRRPGDVAVLTCASAHAGHMGTIVAIEWSARVRRAGLDELCPLRIIAGSTGLPAADRAVAAAIAYQAYGDATVITDLEDALARVHPDDEGAVSALVEQVAPGLLAPAP